MNLKQVMDDNLSDLQVTDELKRRTLRNLKQKPTMVPFPKYVFRAMTLVSSFIVMITLSFQVIFGNPNQGNNDFAVPSTQDRLFPNEINGLGRDYKTHEFDSSSDTDNEDEEQDNNE